MSRTSTWGGGEDRVLDVADLVLEPVTAAEAADVEAVLEAQWATLGPEHDPHSAESWARFEDMVAALEPHDPDRLAAEELAGGLATATRGLGRAGLGADELARVLDADVVEALEAAGRARVALDAVAFRLAREAAGRGLHTEVGLSLVDWLKVHCPWLSPAQAGHLLAMVRAADTHWGAPLAEALLEGRTGLHRAARVARTITRLASSLDVDQQEAYAAIATDAATNAQISDADLGKVCTKLLVDLLDDKPEDESGQTAQQQRCITRRPLGQGMVRYTVDVPEPDAALFDGIHNGPLARPVPAEDGSPDDRSAANRRYDAHLAVLNRGLGNPGAPPSSARASVMLTLRADPQTGCPTGAAFTATGQVLDAAQAGRFACIGDVTPIVLGEHGEPLDLGRTVRLATPGQFKALMVRDGSCTYPGCSVPGTWCDAHHVLWWSRHGGTDLLNLVLLCPRHHTLVHDKDLTATVAGSVVVWHV
ncbi:HNH endonuclease signature motif containing protein [Ornithinimicrobium pekingense]|uniref:HNH nuclease domain-containing protein n=1 Tax=Ornithinimicrobium pekingense TaxID=384677 RepID=A0ABQ2FBK7_9MICO|nr:HNH endonuclease signature motif containing protein [Ornithinimicrobium pekingense]GGK69852.1 hypothetical protein GCM10011509_17830 [Ornithinimicrobium pekingense]